MTIQTESSDNLTQHHDAITGENMAGQQRQANNRSRKQSVKDANPQISAQYKCETAGISLDFSNPTTLSKQISDVETMQLQALDCCKKGEAQGGEMMKLQKPGDNYKDSNRDNEMMPLGNCSEKGEAQDEEMMKLHELGDNYKDNNKDNEVRPLGDCSEKGEAQGEEMMKCHELGDDDKDNNKDNEVRPLGDCSEKGEAQDEMMKFQELGDDHKDDKDNEMRPLQDCSEKGEVQGEEMKLHELGEDYKESNKDNEMRTLQDSNEEGEVQRTEMMKLQELMEDYGDSNKDNEMRTLQDSNEEDEVQSTEMMKLQELTENYEDSNKDNEMRTLQDSSEKGEVQGIEMMKLQEAEYVSSTVMVNKIRSVRKEMAHMTEVTNVFLSECSFRYKPTAQTSEYGADKMSTNETRGMKLDDGKQQEEKLYEEEFKDKKETIVMEHYDNENVQGQTEMLVHAGKKGEAAMSSTTGKMKRGVNCSLELQLINQN
jgi:hypothetical protein